jgi:alpha-mannosidase
MKLISTDREIIIRRSLMIQRMAVVTIVVIPLIMLFAQTAATAEPSEAERLVPGYARTISGDSISYGSPIATATTALLVRATDGNSSMAWETEAVPMEAAKDSITFIWLAGLGSNLGEKRFTLFVNGIEGTSFMTSSRDSWEIRGTNDMRLSFQTVMVDAHKDRFGFMRLMLPPGLAVPGKPVRLRISGEAARSMCWVMTFTSPLQEGITATSRPVIMKIAGKSVQPVDVEIVNIGKATTALVTVSGALAKKVAVPFGVARHTVYLPPVEAEKSVRVELVMGKIRQSTSTTLTPARHWTIYFVQHTHTDIGYTRPQTEILAEHLRYIDYALDYCDQTDNYPDEAKFRWTCETSWAVREYLKMRPAAQIARLKKRVLEGRIEVTGMLLNWAEVADENTLLHSLEPVATLREQGFPVSTAMQDDVNGYAWCLVDYFDGLGIKYVTSGINAARALKPFKVPTPFWWESPSGKRVLAFRADHYMTGNFSNIHSDDFGLVERALPVYLQQLQANGYPYDRVSMQHSGYMTDNSPPSTFASDNIRRWNQLYEWPKLRTATVSEFLRWVEKEHGRDLPVFRAAWPDWWTDGFGCAERETAADRLTEANLIVNQGLLSMAQLFSASLPRPALQEIQSVADNLNFYNEHTFGAAESISDPLAENTQVQWSEKSSYVWQAVMQSRLLREAAMGQLQQFVPASREPCIVVFNTLNWARSGMHLLFADNQVLPKEKEFRIVDDQNRDVPVQLVQSRAEGNYWALWVRDIPPLGYATYRILTSGRPRENEQAYVPGDTVRNTFFRLVLDRNTGSISSLFDRELGRELLDPARTWQLGQFIYERLSDRSSIEMHRLGQHARTSLHKVQFRPGVDGPLWQSILLSGSSDGFAGDEGVTCEIRLFKTAKRIDLVFKGRKVPVTDPEAVYIAFPFSLAGGTLWFEAQGGMVEPGVNQIPGTANDWNTVQNFAALRGHDAQVVLVSDEIPLMQFGGINTGRYDAAAKPESQQIYSWVLNNYWTTNFRASQEGEMTWSYSLTSGADTSNAFATRFGWGTRIPFVSRVLPESATASLRERTRSVWPFAPTTLLLVDTRPAKKGIILHLREVAGKNATLTPSDGWKMEEVDALGGPLRQAPTMAFKPFETKFVKIWK